MPQEDTSIFLNFNSFGPRFSETQKERMLSKPERDTMRNSGLLHSVELLEGLLGKDFEKITDTEIERYCEITDEETHLSITPSSEDYKQLTKRVIHPIVLGKKYFTLGEYTSCIAMAGLAAEMMTRIAWSMNTFSIAGNIMDEKDQKVLFGRLNQERRINILHLVKGIQDETAEMLEGIRNIRNEYTHAWDVDTIRDKDNAKKVIRYALILFKKISGIDLYIDKNNQQRLSANPKFLEFLKSKQKNRM